MPKQRNEQSPVVLTLQANLKSIFDYADRHPELRDRSTPVRLAEWIDEQGWGDRVSKSTIYRMAKAEGPVVTDALELVARAFDLQAWHMLVPGLDPANPPYVLATEQERVLWKTYKELPSRMAALGDDEATAKRQDAGNGRHPAGDQEGARNAPRSGARKARRHDSGGTAAKRAPAKR